MYPISFIKGEDEAYLAQYLPILVGKIEKICEKNGLRNDSIVMRMTGCPNGCARPYVAEIAFVGKAPGAYSMLLGGGYHGERLNKIYRGKHRSFDLAFAIKSEPLYLQIR